MVKFIDFIEKNREDKLNINFISKTLNKLGYTILIASNAELNIDLTNTNNLYYTLLKIYNILKDYENKEKQGKGLKIITPKQMLSRLPVLLAEIHA